MSILASDRLLRVLKGQAVDHPPIWLMRQAGRYLPEYRALRAKAGSFLAMCRNPELACEVTLQPLQRFHLDAAIIFSDILTIPDAMGLGLYFEPGEGPKFERPVRQHAEIERLPVIEPEQSLAYVMQAIQLTVKALQNQLPVIGFCGSPWTVATYMVEGGPSKQFSIIKKMLYQAPQSLTLLLDKLVQSSINYLRAQIIAGAKVVMIFDSWGGVLSQADYQKFSLAPMQAIIQALKADPLTQATPVILFTKGGGQCLTPLSQSGCQVLGLDWMTDFKVAREQVGPELILQGNLDPALLYASPEVIYEQVATLLAQVGHHQKHIFNLGHGMLPDVLPEKVAALIAAVKTLAPQYYPLPDLSS
jgi:uroporphyrinogen decarboxylase